VALVKDPHHGSASVDGASFGPEALKVIGQAFDEAWADIAGSFAEGAQTENARGNLA
jgi:hypothetical protein